MVTIIKQAINGIYPLECFDEFEENYFLSGGAKSVKNYFEIKRKYIKIKQFIKDRVLFFSHSLVSSGVLNEFDLIVCRNVLIYFDKVLQNKTIALFQNSLTDDGYLVLGTSEGDLLCSFAKRFHPIDADRAIFQIK